MTENYTFQSALYLTLAREAEERCEPVWAGDALVSIVMAFMAIEAFINEFGRVAAVLSAQDEKIAQYKGMVDGTVRGASGPEEFGALARYVAAHSRDPEPAVVKTVAEGLAGQEMTPTEERYDLMLEMLGARPGFKGREPRQSLKCLTKVRNYLVHCPSVETSIEMTGGAVTTDGIDLGTVVELRPVPRFASALEARKLVPRGTSRGPIGQDFLNLLCQQHIAKWSCDVAVCATREVVKLLPPSELRRELELHSLLGSAHLNKLSRR